MEPDRRPGHRAFGPRRMGEHRTRCAAALLDGDNDSPRTGHRLPILYSNGIDMTDHGALEIRYSGSTTSCSTPAPSGHRTSEDRGSSIRCRQTFSRRPPQYSLHDRHRDHTAEIHHRRELVSDQRPELLRPVLPQGPRRGSSINELSTAADTVTRQCLDSPDHQAHDVETTMPTSA